MKLELLNPLRWTKSFLLLVLTSLLVIWFLLFDTYSLWTRFELSQQKNFLLKKTEELKQKTEELEDKIEKIKTDPALIEKIAREQYGMQKAGEVIYKIKSHTE